MQDSLNQALPKTKLKDRELWYDGDSVYSTDCLLDLVEQYDVRFVDKASNLISDYNRFAATSKRIQVKETCKDLQFGWNIPEEFLNLNVAEYVFSQQMSNWTGSEAELDERLDRCSMELKMFEERGLIPVLRTIIFVINTLIEQKQVWGVGRGSCVSSYVLYVIGVHDVDSHEYGLEITDFLHD